MSRYYEKRLYNCGSCRSQGWSEPPNILPIGWYSIREQTGSEGMKNRGAFCSLRCAASSLLALLRRRSA
jgi:hypothetical protein